MVSLSGLGNFEATGGGTDSEDDDSSDSVDSGGTGDWNQDAYEDPTTDSTAFGGANYGDEDLAPDSVDTDNSFEGGLTEETYEENSPWEDDDVSDEEIEQDLLERDPYVDTTADEGEVARVDDPYQGVDLENAEDTNGDGIADAAQEADGTGDRAVNAGDPGTPEAEREPVPNTGSDDSPDPSPGSSGDQDNLGMIAAVGGLALAGLFALTGGGS